MKNFAPIRLLLISLLMLTAASAWANDQIVSTVTPVTNPYSSTPIIQINGVSQGNIRLVYTVIGTHFPCGPQNPFATFNLDMLDQQGNGSIRGSYPATLSLADSGNGTPVQLSPSPDTFTVNGIGWSDNSNVSVNIDCGSLPAPFDGQIIDGQMNQSANNNAHLNTVSSVQVHIMLVFPTACLKLYSFESDQNTFDLLTSVKVVPKTAFVKATNPSAVSVDGMVVNTCSDPQAFDIGINLGQYWTNTGANINAATYTYTTSGEVDPSNYGLSTWGVGTLQGQTLCIKNFTVQPGYSFLTRVYSQIMAGTPMMNLPTGSFAFGATLYTPSSNCSGNLLPSTLISPNNPASSSLAWSY
jgi:hypothetical protein